MKLGDLLRAGMLAGLAAGLVGCSHMDSSAGGGKTLVVAFSLDTPPYIMQSATEGLEVELMQALLEGRKYRSIQMPYEQLQTAVQDGKADIAVPVQPEEGAYFSENFITFHNAAINRKSDAFQINAISDLKGHQVLAWQDAYNELGQVFEAMYSPTGTDRQNYAEIPDQRDQVRMFWEGSGKVLVIDRTIFSHFSREMGHSPDDAEIHLIFPPNTDFRAGFKDESLRDAVNQRLIELRGSGEYQRVLDRYGF